MKTEYKEFGYADADPLDCGTYVFPAVLDLGLAVGATPRVLDVGCGNGALAGQFLERGCEVVGIDLSEEGIGLARSAYPDARFEIAEADENVLETLDEQPFDLVVS